MFKNCTCLSSNYSLCTKIYSSLIQKKPCKPPEDGDIIAPKLVGAMQKAVGTNYIKGDILLLHGVTSQKVL